MLLRQAPAKPRRRSLPLAPVEPVQRFLEIDFYNASLANLLVEISARSAKSTFSYVVTPNVDHLVQLSKLDGTKLGADLRQAYDVADISLCDSRILSKLAGLSGIHLKVFAGSDLTRILFEENVIVPGNRVALIGGTALQLDWLCRRWPEITFHQHIPPMGVLNSTQIQVDIVAFVERMRCDFHFFVFGAPQSELIAWRLAQRGKARGVCLCVGASLEFLSGEKLRAPLWMQQLSLEWAFRLASEPRRLWRRYLVNGPKILPIWWRDRRQFPHTNKTGCE